MKEKVDLIKTAKNEKRLKIYVKKEWLSLLNLKNNVYVSYDFRKDQLIIKIKKSEPASGDYRKKSVSLNGSLSFFVPANYLKLLNLNDLALVEYKLNKTFINIEITKPEPTGKAGNCKVIGKAVGV